MNKFLLLLIFATIACESNLTPAPTIEPTNLAQPTPQSLATMRPFETAPPTGELNTHERSPQYVITRSSIFWIKRSQPFQLYAFDRGSGNVSKSLYSGKLKSGYAGDIKADKTGGEWLVALEAFSKYVNPDALLHVINTQDFSKSFILDLTDAKTLGYRPNYATLSTDIDNGKIMLSFLTIGSDSAPCPESVIVLYDIASRSVRLVDKGPCIENTYLFSGGHLQGTYLVVSKDYSDAAGGGNDVVLHDIASSSILTFTRSDKKAGEPDVSREGVVVWKAGAGRFDMASAFEYVDTKSGLRKTVALPAGVTEPKFYIYDSWIHVRGPMGEDSDLVIYDIRSNSYQIIQKGSPASGKALGALDFVDTTVAWYEFNYPNVTDDFVLHWKPLQP